MPLTRRAEAGACTGAGDAALLGFLGMNDLEFIVAGGLNMGESARAQGLEKARTNITTLLAAARKEN